MPKEYPIIFNTEMVRAILDGRKTQTRRVIKPQIDFEDCPACNNEGQYPVGIYNEWPELEQCEWCWTHPNSKFKAIIECPYGRTGDLLWVRETFAIESNLVCAEIYNKPKNPLGPVKWETDEWDGSKYFECPRYKASEPETELYFEDRDINDGMKWQPSIHMPRWASRITLEIINIRVEQIQDISEDDAQTEGAIPMHIDDLGQTFKTYKRGFESSWDSINEKRGYGWNTNPWVWVIEFKPIKGAS